MRANQNNAASRNTSGSSTSGDRDELVQEADRMLAESGSTQYTSREINRRLHKDPLIFTPVGGQPKSR